MGALVQTSQIDRFRIRTICFNSRASSLSIERVSFERFQVNRDNSPVRLKIFQWKTKPENWSYIANADALRSAINGSNLESRVRKSSGSLIFDVWSPNLDRFIDFFCEVQKVLNLIVIWFLSDSIDEFVMWTVFNAIQWTSSWSKGFVR